MGMIKDLPINVSERVKDSGLPLALVRLLAPALLTLLAPALVTLLAPALAFLLFSRLSLASMASSFSRTVFTFLAT